MNNNMKVPAANSNFLAQCFSQRWGEWLSRLLPAIGGRRAPRRLRLCETLALGEKRFIAVVEFDHQQFLVGGGSGSVNLLARVGGAGDFSTVLTEWCERHQ